MKLYNLKQYTISLIFFISVINIEVFAEEVIFEKLMVEEATLFENNPNLEGLKDFNLNENNNNNIIPSNNSNQKKNPTSQNQRKGFTPLLPLKKIYSNEPLALAWSFISDKKIANVRFGEKEMFLKENEKYNEYKVSEITKQYVVLEKSGEKKKYFYKDSLAEK